VVFAEFAEFAEFARFAAVTDDSKIGEAAATLTKTNTIEENENDEC